MNLPRDFILLLEPYQLFNKLKLIIEKNLLKQYNIKILKYL